MSLLKKHFPAAAALSAAIFLTGCDVARDAVRIVTNPATGAETSLGTLCLDTPTEGNREEVFATLESRRAKDWGVSYEHYDKGDLTLVRVWLHNQVPYITAAIDNKQNLMCEIDSATFDKLKPAP